MNTKYGEVVNQVRELCARPIGASLREVSDAIGRTMNIASVYLAKMSGEGGEVVQVGVHGAYRYFKDRDLAVAFDIKAKAERLIQLKESKLRKNARRAKAERDKRARIRAEKGLPPYVPGKSTKPTKTQVMIMLRHSEIHVAARQRDLEVKKQHGKAKIVWPAHVQVQVVPAGRDTRFTFDPPPGWKGQITQDWMDRRLQSMGAR